jgi:hypothetical protein
LQTNLLGATESELNRAAVQGLLEQLRGRVHLVEDSSLPAPSGKTGAAVTSASSTALTDISA